jgi:serine/threonine protein phosphatase PrpC
MTTTDSEIEATAVAEDSDISIQAEKTAGASVSKTAGPFLIERDFAGRQHIGTRRKQEDYYAFADASEKKEPPISRVLVALGDGLGAHLGGNVASYHVVDQFIKKYKAASLPPGWRLRVALEGANESLFTLSSRITIDLPPMGTTLVGCIITENKLWWISVGDSPFYIFRDGTLTRLNADHSLAPMLDERVRNGTLTEEESMAHPDRHVLQSACLGFPLTMVDSRVDPYPLKSGDVLIVASDGILTLQEKQMQDMLAFGKNSSAGKIADALMFAVRCADHPRQDNTTIAVVKVP